MTSASTSAFPRVAVVGCGAWGQNHVRTFAELGALAAISDVNPAVASGLAAKHGVATATFAALLADGSIPALVIAAPAEQHFTLAREALLAGKHLLVEKPIALKVAEAEELCRLAEEHGRVLMVGHILHYHPAFLRLREMVARGDLGRLQYLYSTRVNLGKIRREENILWSFAPHDISMILALVGAEPDRVEAKASFHLHKTIADVTVTSMSFPGGENAHIFVSWLHPYKEQKLVVIGDRGMAVFDDVKPWAEKLVFYPHKIGWVGGVPTPERAEATAIPLEADEPLRREAEHFLHCVARGERPRTDGREGARVLSVLARADAAFRADAAPVVAAPVAAPAPRFPADVTIHESAYVDDGVTIGGGTKIWHFSHVLGQTSIGRNVSVGQNCVIGPNVAVGDNCRIQNNVSLYKGVTLEAGVFCGPSCVFTNVFNPRAEVSRKDEFRPTPVRRGATIGANATIVCGNEVGAWAMIGAGAVVTRNVPPFALMAGVPARRIGWVSHEGEKLGPDLTCPRTGRRYRETGPDTLEEITA